VEEQSLTPRPDGSFFFSGRAPARPGRWFVEVDPRLSALAAERSMIASDGRRLPPPDADSFVARLRASGLPPAGFYETITTANATDAILLKLLRPSVRRRLVLPTRVLFGAAASPRPVKNKEKDPQTFSVVEETTIAEASPPALAVTAPIPEAAPPAPAVTAP
jgi:hypothetical protein